MRNINSVFIIGRLTREPELVMLDSGKSVCRFSIAVNHNKDQVSFFNCSAWAKTAELVVQYCPKGSMVAIDGYLQQNRWEDKSGNKRSDVQVVVDSIQFMSSRENSTQPAPEPDLSHPVQSEGEPELPLGQGSSKNPFG